MTDRTVDGPGNESLGRFEGRAHSALTAMESARILLDKALEAALAGDGFDPAVLAARIKDLGRAVGVALEAEGKADNARLALSRGGGLDLDAARAEIGRRLDRLRAAWGAGGVPG